ncbi:Stk1 family PASTA domain-containing Ser/Thr kinase [Rugosimonospora africana]|uniref:non-specific serine/threonine protein kinase n=1 Tax=Rugosimonospora africana TaxID=556532 RepID=A0A8J3VNR2_9ACTN|nr:Stk1 family PASTA domain-containing Ser/Thr kinase [Rugosimonospora africana]GIH13270.1 serine/threonine protein kinase [Rugosimonospora africana]
MSAGRLLGGRYQVGDLLGYGGMAEVHRGRDLRLGRDVAIKMLRTDLARDRTFQERFRREAQNAASLNHPAIVAVYDTGEERAPTGETIPFIVMEFVNGRTLKEVLTAEGRLMPRRALEITADICAALEFSHRHSIIHRDIKPGNVMLTQTGQVKVMDFGIARALASGATTMTQTSAVIGTAQYLSPEQARGEAVDARSDVYATGCVLYELLTGHPPFVGDNPVSVAYQHVREDPLPPSDSNRDVPPDVDAVVLKALAKNRMNRYQSAGEMRGDVLRAAAGRPVLATPVMPADERTMTIQPQQPRLVGNRNTGTMARVGNPQRRRASNWVIACLVILGVLALGALGTGLYLANKTPQSRVPDLVHQSVTDAQNLLKQNKLRGQQNNTVFNTECTKDTVVDQAVQAQTQVNQNTVIGYDVCGGPQSVKVPPLTGLTQAAAQSALSAAQLKPNFQMVDSLVNDKGKVVSVDPKEGTATSQGQTVTVGIGKGNEAQVPDLSGLTEDQARQRLSDLNFNNVDASQQLTDNPDEVGTVTSQSPSRNTVAKLDAHITIFIGKAAQVSSPSPTVTESSGSPTP